MMSVREVFRLQPPASVSGVAIVRDRLDFPALS